MNTSFLKSSAAAALLALAALIVPSVVQQANTFVNNVPAT